ncbi:MAG TPA: OB-fold nucleic acid binding domain-containing protein, partial [Candidatus Limnocylindria bacterium]|nr:OB-fold nucleic acid binding domain-containing protein [Candidatus Limnocylindria bacterium]
TGIDTTGWARGATLHLQGVVGQRDSSGTGTAGYRLQPRDGADILGFVPPPTPNPSASGSASPSPSGDPSLMSIADARAMPFNARVSVRGIVTLPSDLADDGTAAIQDSSGAILLRLGDEAGSLALGDLIELTGTRSTKSGMETIRMVEPPRRLGHQAQPDPQRRGTGALGEAEEALLVVVRGAVTTSARRTSAENVYFDVDDGSGPIRVFVSPRSEARTDGIVLGSWVEVRGILGQETTGRLPDRGYRIWPRMSDDLAIVATATGSGSPDGGAPRDEGGAVTGAAATAGAGAAATARAAQQGVPRLALSAATASVSPVIPTTTRRADSREHAPAEVAAALLMLGGLFLGGSGWLVAPPGRAGQLLAALRSRLGPRDEPDDAGPPPPTTDPLPTLVPLTVIEGATHGSRSGGKRILPPT